MDAEPGGSGRALAVLPIDTLAREPTTIGSRSRRCGFRTLVEPSLQVHNALTSKSAWESRANPDKTSGFTRMPGDTSHQGLDCAARSRRFATDRLLHVDGARTQVP